MPEPVQSPKTPEAQALKALLPSLRTNKDVGGLAQRAERFVADYRALATDTSPEGRQRLKAYYAERAPEIRNPRPRTLPLALGMRVLTIAADLTARWREDLTARGEPRTLSEWLPVIAHHERRLWEPSKWLTPAAPLAIRRLTDDERAQVVSHGRPQRMGLRTPRAMAEWLVFLACRDQRLNQGMKSFRDQLAKAHRKYWGCAMPEPSPLP